MIIRLSLNASVEEIEGHLKNGDDVFLSGTNRSKVEGFAHRNGVKTDRRYNDGGGYTTIASVPGLGFADSGTDRTYFLTRVTKK